MKRKLQIQLLLMLLFNICCSSHKTLNVGQSETINVEVSKVYENNKNYIFLTKENDIIESSKIGGVSNLKCEKIIVGQKYKFEVVPVSGIIQGGNHFERSYDVNDTVRLNYREYYFAKTIKKYCYKK
ncbi:MAG: hypothetical protein K0R36_2061 [Chryseobacterium sp.]|jgi:hypothetical protein|nr:hypothetical protein [Chryseobacterium sp.]